jgi:hypothetical protein
MSDQTVELAVHIAAAVSAAVRDAAGPRTPLPPTPVAEPERQAEPAGPFGANSVNARLLEQSHRRAALTADYAGDVTAQDVQDADPHVVAAWVQQGKLSNLGVPAQRPRGRR